LFTSIDSERERFLEFERWWNGFYFLGREEMLAIVENLFIGNKLEQGQLRICEGCTVDLRRIRNPLIILPPMATTSPRRIKPWDGSLSFTKIPMISRKQGSGSST
jgi:poly(3-hydroxyalkanoate) synthetase